MYTPSQWLAVGISVAVCALAVWHADSLAQWLPTRSATLSDAEQAQFLASLVFQTTKSQREWQQQQDDGAARPPRLAFCCSADLDVSVRAVDLMRRVHQQHKRDSPKDLEQQHHERIGDWRELQESFAFYFATGAAAEQSMTSPERFREVVAIADEIEGVQRKVGGNAATMADRAAVEGCDVLLGAAIGKHMRPRFNPQVQVVGLLEDEEFEDVHLVLEYGEGDEFRGHQSPRANRYYLNHDIHNAQLSTLEKFDAALEDFRPDLVVIGGLQLMEVETDLDRRLKRLTKLSEVLQNLFIQKIPSHYEFAAVSDFSLFDETVRLVLPWVDSIGLNEQELFILHHFLVNGDAGTATTAHPTVAQITEQLNQIIHYASKSRAALQSKKPRSKDAKPHTALAHLSRIHFHTLHFHIICQQQSSSWEDPTTALIQSALMSTKLACGKNATDPSILRPASEMEVDPVRVELMLKRRLLVSEKQSLHVDIDPFSPIVSWEEEDFKCSLVPMLACKQPDHTAGLGDNISGTGVAYHVRQKLAKKP